MRIAIAAVGSAAIWVFGFGAVLGLIFEDYWIGVGMALGVLLAAALLVGSVVAVFALWEWAL